MSLRHVSTVCARAGRESIRSCRTRHYEPTVGAKNDNCIVNGGGIAERQSSADDSRGMMEQ